MNQEQLFDVVVATIKTNRTNVIALIKRNGIALPMNASDDQIFNAFVSLVRTSAKFREEFSLLVKKIESQLQSTNSLGVDGEAETTTRGSRAREYLGQVFTPEVTSNLINNLFSVFGRKDTDLSGGFEDANRRFDTQEPPKKGLSTGAIIGISVGVIALIGLTIYLVKNKS